MIHDKEHLLYHAVHGAMVAVHAGLAVAILVGGQIRFTTAGYRPLLDISNGVIWPWGAFIGISALLMSSNRFWADAIGMTMGIFWMASFSTMFVMSLQYPTSGSTAFVPYAGFAAINACLLTYHTVDKVKAHHSRKAV